MTTLQADGPAPFIHSTAVVEDGAQVGAFTKVWYFSHVALGARIGENSSLGQNTYVERNAIVGNACRLGNSVSIFSHVELEDFVFCAPYMVFTHISFPRAAVNRHAVFKKTLVKTGTTLGANSTVVPDVTCGVGTFLAAGATLTKSSKDWSMMVGTPARQVGWVSAFGEKIDLPLSGHGEWRCKQTDDLYVLDGTEMTRHAGPKDILKYEPGQRLIRMEVL
ncbi:N-acetyltransferase [Bradyrhizobium sp. LB11.1]|jgi:UDP-2-acetamido-3-amino-2,3-dideoxy-glucuronate N-acetyltransferase|uniref:N-acetyltransferase n=1 Tax=Bradyrhizobium sp. LB11.1 TaxID=3156326 RepID=UPI0033933600